MVDCADIFPMPIGPCGPDLATKQYAISDDGELFENGKKIGLVLTYVITGQGVHVVEYRNTSDNQYMRGKIFKITSLHVNAS